MSRILSVSLLVFAAACSRNLDLQYRILNQGRDTIPAEEVFVTMGTSEMRQLARSQADAITRRNLLETFGLSEEIEPGKRLTNASIRDWASAVLHRESGRMNEAGDLIPYGTEEFADLTGDYYSRIYWSPTAYDIRTGGYRPENLLDELGVPPDTSQGSRRESLVDLIQRLIDEGRSLEDILDPDIRQILENQYNSALVDSVFSSIQFDSTRTTTGDTLAVIPPDTISTDQVLQPSQM